MRFALASVAALCRFPPQPSRTRPTAPITKIDPEKQTITLDDGKSYKVPGEFDVATSAGRHGDRASPTTR